MCYSFNKTKNKLVQLIKFEIEHDTEAPPIVYSYRIYCMNISPPFSHSIEFANYLLLFVYKFLMNGPIWHKDVFTKY